VGTYLKRFGHRHDNKYWWSCRAAQTREHLFRYCSQWKNQQNVVSKEVRKATGWRAGRCLHVQVSELLSMQKCDKAEMAFLIATDIGKFLPRRVEE
jgi:hypothetical protein